MADRVLQVGVKAIIEDADGRILLMQRSQPFHGEDFLKWDIPGGRIDTGEKLEDALRREIKEETGLALQSIKKIFHVQDILFDPKLHVVRVTYEVTATGDVTLSQEHNEFKWFKPEDIPVALTDLFLIEALQANDWISA